MATERFIDLEHKRYADREYDGVLSASGAAREQALAWEQADALARVRARAVQGDDFARDVLLLLGLGE